MSHHPWWLLLLYWGSRQTRSTTWLSMADALTVLKCFSLIICRHWGPYQSHVGWDIKQRLKENRCGRHWVQTWTFLWITPRLSNSLACERESGEQATSSDASLRSNQRIATNAETVEDCCCWGASRTTSDTRVPSILIVLPQVVMYYLWRSYCLV